MTIYLFPPLLAVVLKLHCAAAKYGYVKLL